MRLAAAQSSTAQLQQQALLLQQADPPVSGTANKQRSAASSDITSVVMLQVSGTPERPRLAVYRSNNHIYAQVGSKGQSSG